mmetsp:Transcript_31996/g.37627  ORF Transcript_31996/g.37627 Transcript_31996/m.37627 type:complete len:166 (-) Transcript_31996:269-766(-)
MIQLSAQGMALDLNMKRRIFKPIKLSLTQRLQLVYWSLFSCLAGRRTRNLEKVISKGEQKLEKALDLATIIKLSRLLTTHLRLEYSPRARKLLSMQRRLTVLERGKPNKADQTTSSSSDSDKNARNALGCSPNRTDGKDERLHLGVFYRQGLEFDQNPPAAAATS